MRGTTSPTFSRPACAVRLPVHHSTPATPSSHHIAQTATTDTQHSTFFFAERSHRTPALHRQPRFLLHSAQNKPTAPLPSARPTSPGCRSFPNIPHHAPSLASAQH